MDGRDAHDLRGCCTDIMVHKFYEYGKGISRMDAQDVQDFQEWGCLALAAA